MLVDALTIFESETGSNLTARRRQAMSARELLNKSQYFQLLGAEVRHTQSITRHVSGMSVGARPRLRQEGKWLIPRPR